MSLISQIATLTLAISSLCAALPASDKSHLESYSAPHPRSLHKRGFNPLAFPLHFDVHTLPLLADITNHQINRNIWADEPDVQQIDPDDDFTSLDARQVGLDTIASFLDRRLNSGQAADNRPVSVHSRVDFRDESLEVHIVVQSISDSWRHIARMADASGDIAAGREELMQEIQTVIEGNIRGNRMQARSTIYAVPEQLPAQVPGETRQAVGIAIIHWTVTPIRRG
ncbi:hypothetical protein EJ04DRAFT_563530 [Polyplosphaeria fusca]|uniref:Uncharacterized protein n=1 Tax=Polyplosphaeria fusca TaxID=682080 RepID=A0A9P4R1P3_9PLEO|nr:hypothetical protein EJ04DRAFT_563530 [Polyplosphaeria fusca]